MQHYICCHGNCIVQTISNFLLCSVFNYWVFGDLQIQDALTVLSGWLVGVMQMREGSKYAVTDFGVQSVVEYSGTREMPRLFAQSLAIQMLVSYIALVCSLHILDSGIYIHARE